MKIWILGYLRMPRKPPSASTRRVTRSHSRASSEIGNGTTTTKETTESGKDAKAELTYYTQLRNPSDTSSYEKGKRRF